MDAATMREFSESEPLTTVHSFMQLYGDKIDLIHGRNWHVYPSRDSEYLGGDIMLPFHRALNELNPKETEEVKRLYL